MFHTAKSSRSLLTSLVAACLVASCLADGSYVRVATSTGYALYDVTSTYGDSGYGYAAAPTYYYPTTSYGSYAPSEATYYYTTPSVGGYAPAATTYYTVPAVEAGSYAPAAPTYYYTVPAVEAGSYAPAAPTTYYTVPAATESGSYAPAEPTYFYSASAPAAYGYDAAPAAATYYYTVPTAAPGGYSPAEPTYYYATPSVGGYASSTPTLYYTVPSAAGYASAEPTYYYVSAPAAVAGGYAASTPTYYTVAPSASGYGSAAPTYYYAVPSAGGYAASAPAVYYVTPSAGGYYTAAAAPSCPSCPTCESTPSVAKMATFATSDNLGTCYCPYDHDWATWAIADPSCRSNLYSRCSGAGSQLECSWLDEYFNAGNASAKNFIRPHEAAIEAFLYNDCPPSPPCACAALSFNTKDDPTQMFQCCKALKVHSRVPFGGLAAQDVSAFCDGASVISSTTLQRVSGWVSHQLWHTQCGAPSETVYNYRPVQEVDTTVDASAAQGSSSAQFVPSTTFVRQHQQQEDTTMAAVLVGALVGAGLAVAVAAAVIVYSSSRRGYASLV